MFEYFDKNPTLKKHKRGKNKGKPITKTDCVIRGMMQMLGKSWLETAKTLAERGYELGETQISNKTFESFLKPTGIDVYTYNTRGCRRYKTVAEFAKETAHSYKGYLVSVPHHVVYVKHGKYYDAWDSGKQTVRKIWELK